MMHDSILHDESYEQKSVTFLEVAREYFPDASDDMLYLILCEFTGFPNFWDNRSPVEVQLRIQLQYAKEHPGWHPLLPDGILNKDSV